MKNIATAAAILLASATMAQAEIITMTEKDFLPSVLAGLKASPELTPRQAREIADNLAACKMDFTLDTTAAKGHAKFNCPDGTTGEITSKVRLLATGKSFIDTGCGEPQPTSYLLDLLGGWKSYTTTCQSEDAQWQLTVRAR